MWAQAGDHPFSVTHTESYHDLTRLPYEDEYFYKGHHEPSGDSPHSEVVRVGKSYGSVN